MSKHLIIEIDPNAQREWNRVSIRSPFSYDEPDLKQLIANALEHKPGHYIAKVSVVVEVVEHQPLQEPEVLEREAEAHQDGIDFAAPGFEFAA